MKVAYKKNKDSLLELYDWENEDISELFIANYIEHKKVYCEKTLHIGINSELIIKSFRGELDLQHNYFYSEQNYYLNFIKTNGLSTIKQGDVLLLGNEVRIEYVTHQIIEMMSINRIKGELITQDVRSIKYVNQPIYTSSPRAKRLAKDVEIILELPPEKEKKLKLSEVLLKLIPLGIAIIIAFLMLKIRPRGARGVLMLISMLVSSAISVITLWLDRKQSRKFNLDRHKFYKEYLQKKREDLQACKLKEQEVYNYNDLNLDAIHREITNNSSRLYEREIGDDGFLNIRIGLANQKPHYKINIPESKLKLDKDDLEIELEELANDYKVIDEVPFTIDLLRENIGLVGEREVVIKQLRQMLSEIVFSHSYHDLEIVMVLDEKDLSELQMFKYVKHLNNPSNEWKNIVVEEANRELILNTYLQILRYRDGFDEKELSFVPHILFVITNYDLIASHPIMEFLIKDHRQLGFSLLISTEEIEYLPKEIQTAVNYLNSETAKLVLKNNIKKNKSIHLEESKLSNFDLECDLRKIGQLDHIKGITSAIPEKLGFFELFGVSSAKELDIIQRWQQNRSFDSLKALIGKKSETDYIYLDVHEKAHGPHGLIAGTTGSGKSELIQSYILSLAINYSPEEIGFLLIDYKGGGMANLFNNLPHHLGSITNLDGYEAQRALASIKSELRNRQEIFTQNNVNHINAYQKLYFSDKAKKPMPHLFIISDEFAELKAEQPEFMKELVSAARIGRSLGIHLILATQKPSGVVDEQIWSNAKFKISLKVADESDSRELLKTSDAAYITQAGRAYFKVGNNEIYELFQSAYSGKPYESDEINFEDNRIFRLAYNNQKTLINYNEVQSLNDESSVYIEKKTELDVILEEIEKVYLNSNYQEINRPWLESLGEKMVLAKELVNLQTYQRNLKIEYGLVDLPNQQKQIPLSHDFEEEGHLLIIGSGSSGKTTSLMTIALQLASSNSPEALKMFVIDLGNNGLSSLNRLNHVANYFKIENEFEINRLCKAMQNEINIRKQLLSAKNVNSFIAYNQVSTDKKQSIIIFIDNFGNFKDMDAQIVERITTIVRDGNTLGIHFVISSNRSNDMRSNLFSLFNRKILLHVADRGELNYVLGRSEYPLVEAPGRGQVKCEKPEVCQVYIPFDDDDEIMYINSINNYVNEINDQTNGVKNIGLSNMPEQVDESIIYEDEREIVLGLNYESMENLFLPSEQVCVIEGDLRSGKTNILHMLIEQMKGTNKIALFDDLMGNLNKYQQDSKILYVTELNQEVLNQEVFIFNHLDFINQFERQKEQEVLDILYREFLRGKKFIFEVDEPIRIRHNFGKILQKPLVTVILKDINSQKYVRVKDKDLKKNEYVKFDGYLLHEGEVTRFKPPHVKFSKEISKQVQDTALFYGVEVPLCDMLIAGKNAKYVANSLNDYYNKNGFYSEIITIEELKIDLINREKHPDVYLFTDIVKVMNSERELRKKYIEILETLEEKTKVIVSSEEKFLGLDSFTKKYNRITNILFTQSPNLQNVIRVRERKLKAVILGVDEALLVVDGVQKIFKLNIEEDNV